MTKIIEPQILSTNLYFYKPSITKAERRESEKRIKNEVWNYLKSIGFDKIYINNGNGGFTTIKEFDNIGKITVFFMYAENEKNVRMKFSVYLNNKRTNITTLRKLY